MRVKYRYREAYRCADALARRGMTKTRQVVDFEMFLTPDLVILNVFNSDFIDDNLKNKRTE